MMSRWEFLRAAALGGLGLVLRGVARAVGSEPGATVSMVKSEDRSWAVGRAIDLLGVNPIDGKRVVVKPNFNSAHAFPGSTHNDTLRALIEKLRSMGAVSFKVADRSGMGNTRTVMEEKGIFDMADQMGFEAVVLDELADEEWVHFDMPDTHWSRGLYFPRLFVDAESIVQTCCMKTHRFGGHFTLSLKNSVGMVAQYSPDGAYNFMNELHGSAHQRLMIAEINLLYRPDLVVLDGIEAFVDRGPEAGTLARPGVVIGGRDRVAVDAVGVGVLRLMGTTAEVSAGKVFDQEQIRRAVELGIGVDSPEKIELVVPDAESQAFAESVASLLGAPLRPLSVRRAGWGEVKEQKGK